MIDKGFFVMLIIPLLIIGFALVVSRLAANAVVRQLADTKNKWVRMLVPFFVLLVSFAVVSVGCISLYGYTRPYQGFGR